jgi:hypothetical protein
LFFGSTRDVAEVDFAIPVIFIGYEKTRRRDCFYAFLYRQLKSI